MQPNIVKTLLTACAVAGTITLAACGSSGADADNATQADEAGQVEAPSEVTKLSANGASEEELRTIPGVGENIAHEIVEYRPYDPDTGPAKFRDEMSKYIGDSEIEAIIEYLDFAG